MMIRVMYSDWRQDRVSPEALERLLALNRVKKFERLSGWVRVGSDRIRGLGGDRYAGPERRANAFPEISRVGQG